MPDPFVPPAADDDDDIDKNENLTQVRDFAKRMERKARKLEREKDELSERIASAEKKDQVSAAEQAAKGKGLSDEQFKQLLELKSEPTVEDVDKFAAMVKGSPAPAPKGDEPKKDETVVTDQAKATDPGFTPAPGSQLPVEGTKWDEIKAAIARGDDAFITRVAQEAASGGKPVDFGPFAHLIGASADTE